MEPKLGYIEAPIKPDGKTIYMAPAADIASTDIAEIVQSRKDKRSLALGFTPAGIRKAERLSAEHQGKPIVVLINGKVDAALIVQGNISDGAEIKGIFSEEEVAQIVEAFRDGS